MRTMIQKWRMNLNNYVEIEGDGYFLEGNVLTIDDWDVIIYDMANEEEFYDDEEDECTYRFL